MTVLQGDVRTVLPTLDAGSVQCVITSPPYWGLRDYGIDNQIGLESTPDAYVETLVEVFREVRRVLRDDGTVWLNLGDSYAGGGGFAPNAPSNKRRQEEVSGTKKSFRDGHRFVSSKRLHDRQPDSSTIRTSTPDLKPKDLVGIPWRVAFALQADGWYLRSDIIWAKGVSFCPGYSGTVMPESVTDRPTTSHEHVFLLTKQARYYYDAEAVREIQVAPHREATRKVCSATRSQGTGRKDGGREKHDTGTRNLRSVWTINPQPYKEAHFATFPTALVEPCIKAGSKKGDLVLDPFAGSGTVGCVALKLGRKFVGIELNPAYCTMARESIMGPLFS